MTSPGPPILSYADDARDDARVRAVKILSRCLLAATIAYFTVWIAGWFISDRFHTLSVILYYGIILSLMIFIALLGARLNNVLMGIVLAFLVIFPCAGFFIPIIVLMHARDFLRRVAAQGTSVKP